MTQYLNQTWILSCNKSPPRRRALIRPSLSLGSNMSENLRRGSLKMFGSKSGYLSLRALTNLTRRLLHSGKKLIVTRHGRIGTSTAQAIAVLMFLPSRSGGTGRRYCFSTTARSRSHRTSLLPSSSIFVPMKSSLASRSRATVPPPRPPLLPFPPCPCSKFPPNPTRPTGRGFRARARKAGLRRGGSVPDILPPDISWRCYPKSCSGFSRRSSAPAPKRGRSGPAPRKFRCRNSGRGRPERICR